MRNCDIKFVNKEITPFGGLSLFLKMLEKCHFEEHVMQSGVPLWEKKERLFENVNDQEMVGDYVFRANRLAKTEHSHPLGMVVSTHFR